MLSILSGLLLFSFSNILLLFEQIPVTAVYSVRNKIMRMHSLLTFYMVTFSITNGYDCVEWHQRDLIKTIYIGGGEHYLGGGLLSRGVVSGRILSYLPPPTPALQSNSS